jgi:hypothetical protein
LEMLAWRKEDLISPAFVGSCGIGSQRGSPS